MTALGALARGEEEQALLAMVGAMRSDRLVRGTGDDLEAIAAVRAELVATGLWSLGIAERAGGGGADGRTVALATAAVATAWPAIAVAMSHTQAAGALLGIDDELDRTLGDVASGRPVAVVERPPDATWEHGATIAVPRIDVAADRATIVLLLDDITVAVIPAASARFGPVLRRTGLDGARTVSVELVARSDVEWTDVPTSEVRRVLRRGLTAVAAGITDAAATAAIDYAATRTQFGGPLTALPAVQDALLRQRSGASTAAGAALCDPADPVVAFELLDRALELAIEVAAAAVQTHGGYGYLAEYPVEALLRDAVSLRAVADTAGIRARTASAIFTPTG